VTFKTLMACLRPGCANADILAVTAEIAARFQASVIGLAARQPGQVMFSAGLVPQELVEQEAARFQEEADALETEFRVALQARAKDLYWRARMVVGPLCDYVARESRGADLVIMQFDPSAVFSHPANHVDASDLLMRAGRPVLVAPLGVDRLKFDRVVVDWKETREARRAALDALPFLTTAAGVDVVSFAPAAELEAARLRLEDVVGWLARHGVAAEPRVSAAVGDEASALQQIARDRGADIVVAGAFDHGRLREWAFGGVTRDLLRHSDRFMLLSH
jgi:nucleotide-binding universal stress UspA family protein